ncbi:MAG: pseudouridine synthase [Kangiellaceae bacterium]|nr:pseudouridine synthase [Kangiellaceae bacterium]
MGVTKPDDIKKVRLDKFLAKSTTYSRSEVKRLIRQKRISVDGELAKAAEQKVSRLNRVKLDEELIVKRELTYIAINKPAGYICAAQDEVHPSVLKLLPKEHASDLHFAGRLDVDTTGLVLLSNDGNWTHRVTSPKHENFKVYRVDLAEPISAQAVEQLISGVKLRGEDNLTLPAKVDLLTEKQILLSISEGRYHQVKRMLAAVGNHVNRLHRVSVGGVSIGDLAEGEWKELDLAQVKNYL